MDRNLSELGLPREVLDVVEMQPVEDLCLHILRLSLPGACIKSLIEFDQKLYEHDWFILVRRIPGWGLWAGDERFVDSAGLALHVFTQDPDSDEKAAIISEACRVRLRDAARKSTYYRGLGGLVKATMSQEPSRKTDWATSSGPVQFADLPAGWQRYETHYQLRIRRPIWG